MNELEKLRDKRIGVLCGGASGEREVSLRSGAGVREALGRAGFDAVTLDPAPDLGGQLREAGVTVVYNALHGGWGEDGTIQAVLDYLGMPYTGSGVLACALTMDKLQTKRLLRAGHVPTADWVLARADESVEADAERIEAELGLPVVLKPVSEGSSLGVSIPKTCEDLLRDLHAGVTRYGQMLAERYIKGTELTVGVIGEGERLQALPVLELVAHNEFYDYEAKYTKGLTDLIVPARISKAATFTAQEYAVATHLATDCHGVSRVDLMLGGPGDLWVMELNASPGMTETSDLPAAAAAAGIGYDDLVLEVLRSAVPRLPQA
ncbi:MAG TPA: D-alanine--D-alanine ligase [Armatimonadota bacterium]|jgi:D-alanine-D-alanine ligase